MQVQVHQGDSLWGYSLLYQVPLQLIIDSNPDVNAQGLAIGQPIYIPGYIGMTYEVQPGDSLWKIASSHSVSPELLAAANPAAQAYGLTIGQKLLIPIRVTELVVKTDRPYTYAALQEDLAALREIYPFIRQHNIGASEMGKPIYEWQIGTGPKRVHFNGAIHANEWITTPVLVRFLNEYALAVTSAASIRGLPMADYYKQTMLSIAPMLNPDGVDLVINGLPAEEPFRSDVLKINEGSEDFDGWKANIRGVDLNKQFPALWERDAVQGPQSPAPRDYSGTAPLTEPEVQAIAEWTRQSGFDRVLAFHTQGKEIYWGFQGLEPPESEMIANEFARVSGYTAVRSVNSTAGYKDWFIQDWRKPGFTLELGLGQNPLPLEQLGEIYEASLGIMLAALYM